MNYSELLRNRRAIREFEDKEVDLEIIKEIIKESCLSPSSGHRQERQFVVINNRRWLKRISDVSKKNLLNEIDENPSMDYAKYRTLLENENFNIFFNAPCLIYVLGPKESHTLYVDCTLAACYLMFAATEKGLGTCWIGLGATLTDTDLLKQIGIPDTHKIVAPVILGYPKRIPEAPERKNSQIFKIIT